MALQAIFPRDPDYGRGAYRRRIELLNEPGSVRAALIDDYHEMACVLRHDGARITDVTGEILRIPYNTCPGAAAALRELVGLSIHMTRAEIYGGGRPGRNCTHLFDIAALALAYAADPPGRRVFDIVISDENETGALAQIFLDGQPIHAWTLVKETIVAPPEFSGRRIFGRFGPWAAENFSGVALDAALLIQKAVQLARGRRFLLEEGRSDLLGEPERVGACFTFSEPQFSNARRVHGFVRDFRDGLPDTPRIKEQKQ